MAYIGVFWAAMAKGELNLQQENFVKHYLHNGNASEVAVLAGYSKSGAERAGYKLLQKPTLIACSTVVIFAIAFITPVGTTRSHNH
jgi:hypothetical protein